MTYDELMKQADELEKTSAKEIENLRKRAEKMKAEEAAKANRAREDRIAPARQNIVDALNAYLAALDPEYSHNKELEDALFEGLAELEESLTAAQELAKKASVTLNNKEMSDDEKLYTFLKALL